MPKELFNQALISSPDLPSDEDRIALGQPSVSGGKNVKWSRFIEIIQGFLGSFNWIDFTPQVTPPTEQEARVYFNDSNKAYEAYTEIAGVAPFRLGRVLRSRVLNNSGNAIAKGSLCKIVGLSGTSPIVELADSSKIKDLKLIVGAAMSQILDGNHGYLAVFDTVTGVNTDGMSPDDLIYADPAIPGGFTNIEPSPPFGSYTIGFVSVADLTNGVVAIRVSGFSGSDTSINSKGELNGIVTQTPQIDVVSDGVTITATVSNEEAPGDPLPFIINDKRYLLPTGQSVTVPPGLSATEKQNSVLYIALSGETPVLSIATSEPSIPFAKLGTLCVFNAVRTQTDGKPFSYRRSNNAVDLKNGVNDGAKGLFEDILSSIREKLGSNWLIGQDATTTVNDTTIKIAMSAGSARQFRKASVPSFDGNSYLIYNDITNSPTYAISSNLTDITADALGNSLLSNNKFYTIRIFYQLNSNGIGNNVIATRPTGSYAISEDAIADPLNYAVSLNDTDIEETIYPLYDLVIGRTGSGGSIISLEELIDRRSKLAGGSGGGGASGGGTDDKIRITANDTTNDYLNPKITVGDEFTKEIVNPAGNENLLFKFKGWIFNTARTFKTILSSGSITADRTLTVQDKSGKILVDNGNDATVFENTKTETFAASVTLDLSTRLNFSISITGNITIDASNLADGQAILIECTIATATPPTITLAAKFVALDDAAAAPTANGDVFYIIGFVDGTNINYDIRTKIA